MSKPKAVVQLTAEIERARINGLTSALSELIERHERLLPNDFETREILHAESILFEHRQTFFKNLLGAHGSVMRWSCSGLTPASTPSAFHNQKPNPSSYHQASLHGKDASLHVLDPNYSPLRPELRSALPHLEKVCNGDSPAATEARLLLGQVLYSLGDLPKAEEQLCKVDMEELLLDLDNMPRRTAMIIIESLICLGICKEKSAAAAAAAPLPSSASTAVESASSEASREALKLFHRAINTATKKFPSAFTSNIGFEGVLTVGLFRVSTLCLDAKNIPKCIESLRKIIHLPLISVPSTKHLAMRRLSDVLIKCASEAAYTAPQNKLLAAAAAAAAPASGSGKGHSRSLSSGNKGAASDNIYVPSEPMEESLLLLLLEEAALLRSIESESAEAAAIADAAEAAVNAEREAAALAAKATAAAASASASASAKQKDKDKKAAASGVSASTSSAPAPAPAPAAPAPAPAPAAPADGSGAGELAPTSAAGTLATTEQATAGPEAPVSVSASESGAADVAGANGNAPAEPPANPVASASNGSAPASLAAHPEASGSGDHAHAPPHHQLAPPKHTALTRLDHSMLPFLYEAVASIYDRIAVVCSRRRLFGLLVGLYERSLKFSYRNSHVWLQYPLVLLSAGHYRRACLLIKEFCQLEVTNKAMKVKKLPSSNEALALLLGAAVSLNYLDDIGAATEFATEAVSVFTHNERPLDARSHQALGLAYRAQAAKAKFTADRKGLQMAASQSLYRAHILDKTDPSITRHLALAYADIREISMAIRYAQLSIQQNPSDSDTLHLMALILSSQREYAKAIQICNTILDSQPTAFAVLLTKAALEHEYLGAEHALETFSHMLKTWRNIHSAITSGTGSRSSTLPRSSSKFMQRLVTDGRETVSKLGLHSQDESAETPASSSKQASQRDVDAETSSGRGYDDASSFVDSTGIGDVQTASAVHHGWLILIWIGIARAFISLEKYTDAVVCLKEAKSLYPLSAPYYYLSGLIHEKRKEFLEASLDYERALAIKPDHLEALIQMGVVAREQGNLAVAEKFLTDATVLDTTSHQAWYNLGYLLQHNDRHEHAAQCFSLAIDLEQSAPIVPYSNISCLL